MKSALLSTAYLAPVSYYAKLLSYPEVWLEQCEHYLKQTYRNRCHIAAPTGLQALTLPVEHQRGVSIRDIRLSSHGNWQHTHWQALVTAYDNSPYFEYYADDFLPFYTQPQKWLWDFNEGLRQMVCDLIGLQPNIHLTATYDKQPAALDLRTAIRPKNTAPDPHFVPAPYHQVFEQRYGFLPDLSIADLLFNQGPESLIVLQRSMRPVPPRRASQDV